LTALPCSRGFSRQPAYLLRWLISDSSKIYLCVTNLPQIRARQAHVKASIAHRYHQWSCPQAVNEPSRGLAARAFTALKEKIAQHPDLLLIALLIVGLLLVIAGAL
jgi:hypothetical protein